MILNNLVTAYLDRQDDSVQIIQQTIEICWKKLHLNDDEVEDNDLERGGEKHSFFASSSDAPSSLTTSENQINQSTSLGIYVKSLGTK